MYRVWKLYQTHGVVRKQQKFTPISSLTIEDAVFVRSLVDGDPSLYLDEYQALFESERGRTISTSSLLGVFHVSTVSDILR